MGTDDGVQGGNARRKRHQVTRIKTSAKLPTLTHLAHKPLVNIEFENLQYSVHLGRGKGEKSLLKCVSGIFRAGELSAIMGPSGAGKSTLLNILTGYTSSGVHGSINVNGQPRDLRTFHKLSCYIMQEDLVQPLLTVNESMHISANLKLGDEFTKDQKRKIVDEVLETLGLSNCKETRVEKLSGGQRKRFSIALELVNNPPVIFLDEPTTGLDMSSSTQCLSFLKTLAQQGRTIICSIHTPSASQFALFDNVYVLARGLCIYQGSSDQIVPYLSSVGLECPKHYNPADYILEVTQLDNEGNIDILSKEVQNGRLRRVPTSEGGEFTTHKEEDLEPKELVRKMTFYYDKCDGNKFDYPTSTWTQFCIIFKRAMLQTSRNMIALGLMVFTCIISSALVGSLFYNVGNKAELVRSNLNFFHCCIVFFFYNQTMNVILLFPNEVKLLKREYFNRWYGLKSFYAAVTLARMPIGTLLNLIFLSTCYLTTDQPWEIIRFLEFSFCSILFSFVSEGMGMAVASACSPTSGAIIFPTIGFPILAISILNLGTTTDFSMLTEFILSLSFVRYAFVALVLCMYGGSRGILECSTLYCHFKEPTFLIKFLGMKGCRLYIQVIGLVGYLLLFRFISYIILRWRITPEFSNPVFNYLLHKIRKR